MLATAEAKEHNITPTNPDVWEQDGTYYVGFHHTEPADSYALECEITEEATCAVPTR